VKLNVDDDTAFDKEHALGKLPTFLIMAAGKVVDRFEGANVPKLRLLVEKHAPGAAAVPAAEPSSGAPAPQAKALTLADLPAGKPPPAPSSSVRIFVSGSASGAGKSTVSLALLGAALESGMYSADELAYIKPATQGVQQTLTAKYCASMGIACRHVGPVVFYNGFTQEFVEGKCPKSSAVMLEEVRQAVAAISAGKRLTIIDGVGYPAVGSIVGVCNAETARASGAAVLMVGKAGLGDAVDSFNMASSYFEARGVAVLGTLINRVAPGKMQAKTEKVFKYFEQYRPSQRLYGLLLENATCAADHDGYAPPGETNACSITKGTPDEKLLVASACGETELALCHSMIAGFLQAVGYAQLSSIFHDAASASGTPVPLPTSGRLRWVHVAAAAVLGAGLSAAVLRR